MLVAGGQTPVAADDGWLPLTRPETLELLFQEYGDNPPRSPSLDDMLAALRANPQPNDKNLERAAEAIAAIRARLAPATVWHAVSPDSSFSVYMAGAGKRLHSLRIAVYVVNNSKEQNARVFRALSKLFTELYPESPNAADWPTESLDAAWENHPLARKTPLVDPDEAFIRHSDGGIVSTTFGVPPDIAVYDVTVRESCIPVSAQGNPFVRMIC